MESARYCTGCWDQMSGVDGAMARNSGGWVDGRFDVAEKV